MTYDEAFEKASNNDVTQKMKVKTRCDDVIKLRQAHFTYEQIATKLGISRQQVKYTFRKLRNVKSLKDLV